MSQPETRHSLLIRLKDERNDAAWTEFAQTYEPFLRQVARRRGVAGQDIPDAVQQVLMTIARSLESWQDDGQAASFRRWLRTVARNVVINFLVKENRQASGFGTDQSADLLAQIAEEPDEALCQKYEHELIVWAAERVRDEFVATSWAAFWATVIEGRSVSAVASELGVSAGSIYMSRSRIKARIRQVVSEVME